MSDISAHRGVIICNKGFTDGAKKLAPRKGIDLCRIHDAETENWNLELKLPVIVEEICPNIDFSQKFQITIEEAGTRVNVQEFLKECFQIFKEEWNSGRVPVDKERLSYDLGISNPVIQTSYGQKIPVKNLVFDMFLQRSLYFGYFTDLPTSKALENSDNGKTRYLVSHADALNINKSTLTRVKSMNDIPVPIEVHIKILQLPKIGCPGQYCSTKIVPPKVAQVI